MQQKRKKGAKRNDVATLAGVSGATVSFVFSNKRHVSSELRERVYKAAEALDYHPDMVAASLRSQTTNTIAVITDDITSPLQMEIIRSIQAAAIEHGYFVHICGGTVQLESYVINIISRKVDGVFLSVSAKVVENESIHKMLDRNISVIVTSSRGFPDDRICGLELDFPLGMKKIVEYLKGLGHTEIAYLSCFDEQGLDRRLSAFRTQMREQLGSENPLIFMGEPPYPSTIEKGQELTRQLLKTAKPFTAVVCTNDLMALGASRVLIENGLRIPQDVSVVGIDDIPYARAAYPALTTLSHCSDAYGRKIFDILYDNITDKNKIVRDKISPELVVRESTAVAKKK